jgi:hypothetical protein
MANYRRSLRADDVGYSNFTLTLITEAERGMEVGFKVVKGWV